MAARLHLGCGQVYLEGYVNIDYPLSEHTVQQKSVADEFANLTDMRRPADSIDEVRLHHVFEHFPRPQAVALLASWHSWLKKGGRLHIEVPDFEKTAKLALDPKAKDRDRKVAIRHIFGSNEAPWAIHYDGWTAERLRELVETFGFKTESIEPNEYLATRNITIIATKAKPTPAKDRLAKIARDYLTSFTLNDSDFESRLLDIWLADFKTQLNKTFAR